VSALQRPVPVFTRASASPEQEAARERARAEQQAAQERERAERESSEARQRARDDAERRPREPRSTGGGSGGGGGGEDTFTYWVYFFITLALHVWISVQYKEITRFGYFMLLYLVVFGVFVLGSFAYFRRREPDDVRGALAVTCMGLILYMLPSIVNAYGGPFATDGVRQTLAFIVVYIPAWPVFLMTKIENNTQSRAVHWIFGAYKVVIVVLVLYTAGSALLEYGLGPAGAVNIGVRTDLWLDFKNFWIGKKDAFSELKTSTQNYVKRATDPQAYYTGQVEENKKVPLGVEITTLRPLDETIPNDVAPIVYGTVKSRPFKDRAFIGEDVKIIPACTVRSEVPVSAAADPPEMTLVWGTSGTFQCTFPKLEEQGSYQITGSATFPFQTWAYLEYTLVDEQRARALARQGLDVTQELNIVENPIATFTGGPVLLGMGGTPQPILVNLQGDNDRLIPDGTRLGITIDSNWHGGKVNHIDRLELRVPDPFYLEQCDRAPRDQGGVRDGNDDLYMVYEFDNPDLDELTGFASVTCKLNARRDDRLTEWLGVDKAVLTFVGSAYYTYTIEEHTSVSVREVVVT
jgi:hypothetical protein